MQGLKIRKQRSTGDLDRKGVMGRLVLSIASNKPSTEFLQYPLNGFDLVMDVKRVELRGGLRHV